MRLILILGSIAVVIGAALLFMGIGYVAGFYYLLYGLETYVLAFGGIFSAIGVTFLAMSLKLILSNPKTTS